MYLCFHPLNPPIAFSMSTLLCLFLLVNSYLCFKTQLTFAAFSVDSSLSHFFSQLLCLVHVSLILLFTIHFSYMFSCLSLLR